MTAAVTPPKRARWTFEDILRVWRNSQRSSGATPFVPAAGVDRADFWLRRRDGGFEPPRVVVPGTAVTASALLAQRHDEDSLVRAWLDAFLWQWRKQRGVHPRDVVTALHDLHLCVRADRPRGNGYHGNTQQTLPLWHVPIDGKRWEDVIASAARAVSAMEERWAIVVPVT